jgi:hypothetical protein
VQQGVHHVPGRRRGAAAAAAAGAVGARLRTLGQES